MRLCNAFTHYVLFISLTLFIFHCYAHEHHNHVDPVRTKYSQSAVTIDPLSKNIENANIQNHNDDEHLHDTIEARLRTKHDLRQSVHRHSDDDDIHENEEDYINRLNSALENDYKTEHQFQYEVPPIADLVNNTLSINQTEKDDARKSSHIPNETVSSPSTSIQTPIIEEQTDDEFLSSKVPVRIDSQKHVQNSDEKLSSKIISDKIAPPIQVQNHEEHLTDTTQQNIIKEDFLYIHKETIPPTQLHSPTEKHKELESTDDLVSPASDEQLPIFNPIINETSQDNSSLDVKPSSSTPLPLDQTHSVKSETIRSSDIELDPEQPKTPQSDPSLDDLNLELEQHQFDSRQNVRPLDVPENQKQQTIQKPEASPSDSSLHLDLESEQQTIQKPERDDLASQQKPDTIQNTRPSDHYSSSPILIKSDQEDVIPDSIQNVSSSNSQEKLLEPLQNTSSKVQDPVLEKEEQQLSQTINTIEPTETVPIDKKSDDTIPTQKESPTLDQTLPPPTARNLRSTTSRIHQKVQARQRQNLSKQEPIKTPQELENNSSTESTITESTTIATIEPPTESLPPPQPPIETAHLPPIDLNITDDNETLFNDQNTKPTDTTDLPRQVHVHDLNQMRNELKEELNKNDDSSFDQEIENNATVDSFLTNDHSPHLPRILENDEILSTIDSTQLTTAQTHEEHDIINPNLTSQIDSKIDETNNSLTLKSNNSDKILPIESRQVCWRLPKPFEPSLELIENQFSRALGLLPEYIQTIFLERIDDRERLMNTLWFSSISSMCFLFSFIFLSMGAKRLKQSKAEKEIRARCQQLQQYNNQIELERATFERQNQKLSDEIDELKNLPIRDSDEEVFQLREQYDRVQADWRTTRMEHDALLKDVDYKQSLLQKHEFDMQKQVEIVAHLNDEILRQKQELEKERERIAQLQSNDLSLERFDKLQEIIQQLKTETSQLKQDNFDQTDQLQQLQQHSNQLDLDNHQLTIKMKQLKDLLEQRDQSITQIRQKMLDDNQDDEQQSTEITDLLSTVTQKHPDKQKNELLLSTIDHDVEKANQHMRDMHSEIDEKTRRIKELDSLLNQEKDHTRELETKLKVVLELRERDAHLHIRQLGQSDSELRKARTDTERVRILQQQLQLKQQQLDDVQKVLATEQTKFSEECSKLQHETHERWMEVKRVTRELEGSRKECEGLRRQISKYGNSERSSQDKTMLKPVAQHLNNTGRLSSEPEMNGNTPPPPPSSYQQGDNFRPIDHERNDSGAASPSEMFRIRPPLFGMHRPPFFPPPFMAHPPNPFMMGARFPMPVPGLHGMISPVSHLITNGSGGSDSNSFEMVDPSNITPNSSSHDPQFNGSAISPMPEGEQQTSTKVKKPKKSLKKKTKTSTTTTVASESKEGV